MYRSPHFFVSPGDAPATITQYVAWMERQFNACQTPCSMCLSIFNSFRVIRCLSQCVSPKIAIFYHILVSPGDAPKAITLNVVWMEREFDAYKLSRGIPIYLQQFPSYSNCKCKKSPFLRTAAHIFVSPGDAPGEITLSVVWMEREFDAYKLSCCICPSNYNRFWDRARYLWKVFILSYPLAFEAPLRGVPVGISAPPLVWKN